ncbi:class I SAM-dependent methyltransferase [Streptomyces sp. RLB3-5]|nr:class I SAM-dependent methyltransferase [Streptomyces sp. RLB3-5]QDO61899.1 class I SAM-dependent methyltransferase [Streptomyces sp. RLB1-8]
MPGVRGTGRPGLPGLGDQAPRYRPGRRGAHHAGEPAPGDQQERVGRVAYVNVFAGTSAYYRRFRPGIPVALAVLLDQAAPTDSPRRLLDIGTGPGLVVHALLPYFDDLFAVDAEPGMLTEAEAMLRPALDSAHRLQLRHALAEDFLPPEGWQPHLVTCGRVFHWLNQPRFLDRLSEYMAPEGGSRSSATGVCGPPTIRGSRSPERWSRTSSASNGEPATAPSAPQGRRMKTCSVLPPSHTSPPRSSPFAGSGRSRRSWATCTQPRSRPRTCSATAATTSNWPLPTPSPPSPTEECSRRTTCSPSSRHVVPRNTKAGEPYGRRSRAGCGVGR